MQNLFTPIDMIGAMVTERRPDEPLSDYRRRVLQVAGVVSHRDASSEDWVRQREQELSGRTGYPVRLYPGGHDPALRARAERLLFTYDRLAEWTGPFRWPAYGASGEKTYYNMATPGAPGVGSLLDLEPAFDEETGRYYVTPGMVVLPTGPDDDRHQIWYVPARLTRIALFLPPGTTETAVPPVQVSPGFHEGGGIRTFDVPEHGHRFEVIDEMRLRMVAADHEHIAVRTRWGWAIERGPHEHELIPVETGGPCFMAVGRRQPQLGDALAGALFSTIRYGTRTESIDGFLGVPVLNLGGQLVVTDDGEHEAWVDPYDYYAGRFTIGDETHVHVVRPSDDGEYLLCEPATPDGHTHTIPLPQIPSSRLVLPYLTQYENHVYDLDPAEHPFMVKARIDHGWTVISSSYGLGEQLTLAFDQGELLEVPSLEPRAEFIVGLGPDEEASRIHVLETRPHVPAPGDPVSLTLRSEDPYTGGVPHTSLRVEAHAWTGGVRSADPIFTATPVTDESAEAQVTIPTLEDAEAVEVTLFLDGAQQEPSLLIALSKDRLLVPAIPAPQAPAYEDGAVTLSWGAVRGATEYEVQVSEGAIEDGIITNVPAPVAGVPPSYQRPGAGPFLWRVRAVGEGGPGAWSSVQGA